MVQEISHSGLGTFRRVTGPDKRTVDLRAEAQVRIWSDRWAKKTQSEQKAAELQARRFRLGDQANQATARTEEAKKDVHKLENILADGMAPSPITDPWALLVDRAPFPRPEPIKPARTLPPPEPLATDPRYQPTLIIIDKLFRSRGAAKISAARALFEADRRSWLDVVRQLVANDERKAGEFDVARSAWHQDFDDFVAEQEGANSHISEMRRRYLGGEADAVEQFCEIVVTNLDLPECFPGEAEFGFEESAGRLIVELRLPAPADLPTLREVRFVKSRQEFSETHSSPTQQRRFYDDVIYKAALRILHELFRADHQEHLKVITLNGFVKAIDPATGQIVERCILSLQVQRAEFTKLNLAAVDPKACFRQLKGIGSSTFAEITPIRPILRLNREDRRFVEAHEVADGLDPRVNLAAMDWEEFEYLIRELFDQEFSRPGAEVKITRASRDAGVDAVAFDPDPIRGGKIVIQAKRYTRTVDLSAVRDLYGTVVNEGANKGILVTTADYGPDAYEFVKDKPLTLLNGAELLYLMEKHGHPAMIDLKAARAAQATSKRIDSGN